MKQERIVIWLLGSSASGKTTQAKLLHKLLSNGIMNVVREDNYKYTTFGTNIANLGVISDKDCCGTDTLSTKEQITNSYNEAMKKCLVVCIEGIMATAVWPEFILSKEIKDKYNVKLFTILLDCDLETNLKRLHKRRTDKGKPFEITEATKKSLFGKIRGFRSIYERTKPSHFVSMELDTRLMSIERIHMEIINKLHSLL